MARDRSGSPDLLLAILDQGVGVSRVIVEAYLFIAMGAFVTILVPA